MRYIVIAALLSFNFLVAQNKEVRKFEIRHKGKALGQVIGTKEVLPNGNIQYTTKASINKQVLTIKTLDYNLVVEMKDGVLYKSDYKLYVNGKLKNKSDLHTENGVYIRSAEGKNLDPITTPIDFVSSMFLFQSPKGSTKTFSESKQKFRTIYPDASNPNKFSLGKSSKNLDTNYTYEADELIHVFIDDFVNFTMVPIN